MLTIFVSHSTSSSVTPVEKTMPGAASDEDQEVHSPKSILSSPGSEDSQDPALLSITTLTPESTTHPRSLSDEFFFVFDNQGDVEHVSDRLHAATDTRKGEFVGMNVIEFLLKLTGADADDESRRINMIVFFENLGYGGTEIISVVTGSGDETTPMSLRITDSTGVLEVVDY